MKFCIGIKKTCQYSSVVNVSKALLMKWKKDCEAQIQKTETEHSETKKIENNPSDTQAIVAQKNEIVPSCKGSSSQTKTESVVDEKDDFDDESIFLQLTPTRRKVLFQIITIF